MVLCSSDCGCSEGNIGGGCVSVFGAVVCSPGVLYVASHHSSTVLISLSCMLNLQSPKHDRIHKIEGL